MDFINKNYSAKVLLLFCIIYISSINKTLSQCLESEIVNENIEIKENGKIDFTIIGNSQNQAENNLFKDDKCNQFLPVTTTSATLDIPTGDSIKAAHLYWSGSGTPINTIQLNGVNISSDKCWSIKNLVSEQFSAYANVTNFVQQQGQGKYTLSGLDNRAYYEQYRCSDRFSSLYGGWALVVVFKNEAKYENNTIYFYDGFDYLQDASRDVSLFTNVFDQFDGSHIGVIAWEGDVDPFLGFNNVDNITLNGEILPSRGYDSVTNIFNGTESFSNPTKTTYNVDIDDFDASNIVEENLNNGPTNFNFNLSTGRDVVILSSIIFRIPNEAPDATIELETNIKTQCDDTINLEYTYFNADYAQKELPKDTVIHFYLNTTSGQLIGSNTTTKTLLPGEKDTGTTVVNLPKQVSGEFKIIAYIDPPNKLSNETYGSVLELEETNNTSTTIGNNTLSLLYPTAFTPNNDGINDYFKGIINSDCDLSFTNYKLEIFNRFGNLVATIKNNNLGWDGKIAQQPATPGLYTWVVEYSIGNNPLNKKTGALTLIR